MTNPDHAPAGAAGAIVRPEINGGTKVIRVSDNSRWNDEAEERFLEELAATCNVRAAAQAAGFSTTAVYKRRMKYPGFAADWLAAIDQGYARLEALLVERATDSLLGIGVLRDGPSTSSAAPQDERVLRDASSTSSAAPQDERVLRDASSTSSAAPQDERVLRDGTSTGSVPPQDERSGDDRFACGREPRLVGAPMTVAEALNVLRLHRSTARGGKPQNFAVRAKAPDWDEVSESILRKIRAIKAARGKGRGPQS